MFNSFYLTVAAVIDKYQRPVFFRSIGLVSNIAFICNAIIFHTVRLLLDIDRPCAAPNGSQHSLSGRLSIEWARLRQLQRPLSLQVANHLGNVVDFS